MYHDGDIVYVTICPQYSTLARRFRDVMMKFNQEEEEYREKNKDKIQRQLKIGTCPILLFGLSCGPQNGPQNGPRCTMW